MSLSQNEQLVHKLDDMETELCRYRRTARESKTMLMDALDALNKGHIEVTRDHLERVLDDLKHIVKEY